MVLEALVGFVAAAAFTIVVGAPLASRMAQPKRIFAPPEKDREARKPRTDVIRAFTPLDLGPDPVKWPSQRPWELQSTIKVPEWPSHGWNDEHFGKHWHNQPLAAADTGFHAMADRQAVVDAGGPPAEPRKRKESPPRPTEVKVAPTPVAPTQAEPARQTLAKPAKQAPPKPATPARPAAGPPSAAEIEHLIATQGLAATVQLIMVRTGWDFREAAQYLAKLRKME